MDNIRKADSLYNLANQKFLAITGHPTCVIAHTSSFLQTGQIRGQQYQSALNSINDLSLNIPSVVTGILGVVIEAGNNTNSRRVRRLAEVADQWARAIKPVQETGGNLKTKITTFKRRFVIDRDAEILYDEAEAYLARVNALTPASFNASAVVEIIGGRSRRTEKQSIQNSCSRPTIPTPTIASGR